MTNQILLSSLAKLAAKQAQPVKPNKTFNELIQPKIEAPKIPMVERSDLSPIVTIAENSQEKFAKYCEQIDRLKTELGIDMQEILFNAIDLYFQSEILN